MRDFLRKWRWDLCRRSGGDGDLWNDIFVTLFLVSILLFFCPSSYFGARSLHYRSENGKLN